MLTPMTTVIVEGVNEKLLIVTLTVACATVTGAYEIAENDSAMTPSNRIERSFPAL